MILGRPILFPACSPDVIDRVFFRGIDNESSTEDDRLLIRSLLASDAPIKPSRFSSDLTLGSSNVPIGSAEMVG